MIPQVTRLLAQLDGRTAMRALQKHRQRLCWIWTGTAAELAEEDLLIETVQPEGLASVQDRDLTVALDLHLTPELIEEGFVREIISKVQTMRKDADFDIMDRIVLRYAGNARIAAIMERHGERIAEEVLAARIETGTGPHSRNWDLNGEPCTLSVEQIAGC